MKKMSTLVLAAGLVALGGCGGGTAVNNVTITNSADDLYTLPDDSLGGNLTNESFANELGGNTANASSNAAGNAVSNSSSNAASNAAGNRL